jgi:hypothetical protein
MQRAVASAFTAGRQLQNGLLSSELFANIAVGGYLPRMTMDLNGEIAHLPLTDPARTTFGVALGANSMLRKLTTEILLALDGFELRRRVPMPRRNPPSLRRLGELLPS